MVSIDDLLKDAKEKRASDLHITVGISPLCRVNGELIDMGYEQLLPADTKAMLDPIMSNEQRATLEKKGDVDITYVLPSLGRYRSNIYKQRGSYACVIRLVDKIVPTPEELCIPESVVELKKKKRGLILITGPSGCGKSTTLASLIDVINTNYKKHIITIEDPIEYLHNHKKSVVNQREIGIDTLSYEKAFRAALREDPNVILLGELRDLETISIAIRAAETGHLVLSALYTSGAVNTIDQIIEIFPPDKQQLIRVQLASVLETVVSKQLIPTADGKGRVPVYEVMHATPAIKSLIREGKTQQINPIIQASKKLGMQLMDDAIYDLYLKGVISAQEATNYAQDPISLGHLVF